MNEVSIPIGFSNELQPSPARPPVRHIAGFQSLSGFPMSCNDHHGAVEGLPGIVSIPIGFSNELQRKSGYTSRIRPSLFQSLSGFPMSCNSPPGGE